MTGGGAGPILVVGTTGDPATPLASTQAMADALEGAVLLTVVADQHTGYGVNDCSIEVVDRVLIELVLPAQGTSLRVTRDERTAAPYGAAVCSRVWRKEWDSNPRRPRRPQQFSRLSHSSTLASFRGGRLAASPTLHPHQIPVKPPRSVVDEHGV